MQFNQRLLDVINLVQEIDKLDSDLYGWIIFSGHVRQLEIDIHRYSNGNVNIPVFKHEMYLTDYDDAERTNEEITTLLERIIVKLVRIKEEETIRIEEYAVYKKLKEKYEGRIELSEDVEGQ
jgi:hypothetical protein